MVKGTWEEAPRSGTKGSSLGMFSLSHQGCSSWPKRQKSLCLWEETQTDPIAFSTWLPVSSLRLNAAWILFRKIIRLSSSLLRGRLQRIERSRRSFWLYKVGQNGVSVAKILWQESPGRDSLGSHSRHGNSKLCRTESSLLRGGLFTILFARLRLLAVSQALF